MAQNNPNSRFDRLRSLVSRKPTTEIPLEPQRLQQPPRPPAANQYPGRQPIPPMHHMEPGRSYRPEQPLAQPQRRPEQQQPVRPPEQRPLQPEQHRPVERQQPTERREQPRPQTQQRQRPTATQPPTPAPTPPPTPPAPPGQKSATYHQVETILEEGLEESWRTMTPEEQQMFKLEGEITTGLIADLVATAKATAEAVLDLIKNWLKLIPRVNKFFLEQQSKIKTDRVIALTQTQNNQIQPPLSTKNAGPTGQGIEIEKG